MLPSLSPCGQKEFLLTPPHSNLALMGSSQWTTGVPMKCRLPRRPRSTAPCPDPRASGRRPGHRSEPRWCPFPLPHTSWSLPTRSTSATPPVLVGDPNPVFEISYGLCSTVLLVQSCPHDCTNSIGYQNIPTTCEIEIVLAFFLSV